MNGRRIPDGDHAFDDLHAWQPGDYGIDADGRLWAVTPPGELMHVDDRWGREIHADGSISVVPASPGESYSIRQSGLVGWHGYLTAGVWITLEDSEWQPAA